MSHECRRCETLTDQQTNVLNFIIDSTKSNGFPPTVREIGQALDLRSPSTVHAHLLWLCEHGFISQVPGKSRTLVVTTRGTAA